MLAWSNMHDCIAEVDCQASMDASSKTIHSAKQEKLTLWQIGPIIAQKIYPILNKLETGGWGYFDFKNPRARHITQPQTLLSPHTQELSCVWFS